MNMKKQKGILYFLLVALLAGSTQVSAGNANYEVFLSARELHKWQTRMGAAGTSAALAYIEGVTDVLSIQKVVCAPRIQGIELEATVRTYNEAHPENWEYNAADVVFWALTEKWSCGKKVRPLSFDREKHIPSNRTNIS
jgi:hypothetical protein